MISLKEKDSSNGQNIKGTFLYSGPGGQLESKQSLDGELTLSDSFSTFTIVYSVIRILNCNNVFIRLDEH